MQWFGGKRAVVDDVWQRFGTPKQYLEPFCGSAAILLGAREPASLEVIGDLNGFVANFWRCAKMQPAKTAEWADYPVSHIDLGARHRWLMKQRDRLGAELHDPNWPGDPQVAGWWLWGQCAWIGSGWCDWFAGQIPHVTDAGRGIQASGQIPHVTDAGRGIQASGQIPHVGDAGMGHLLTTGGQAAWVALHKLAARLDRVRVIHGEWSRCLNHHYGKEQTAVFLDPPYVGFEALYGDKRPVALDVCEWAREHAHLRVALCGHVGDYDLPGWEQFLWSRDSNTYGSDKTKDAECIWFSPACLPPTRQGVLDL
jgi:DNA adenine methylase